MQWFISAYPDGSTRSMDFTLKQMVDHGTLIRTKNGVFCLAEDVKPIYRPVVNDEMKSLLAAVKEQYPYTTCALWQASELGSFMQHVPNLNMLILEVESAAAEAVYEDVRGRDEAGETRKSQIRKCLGDSTVEFEFYSKK